MRFLGFGLCLILLACGSEDGRLKGDGATQVMAKPALAGLYLDELSAAQWQETCEWMVEVQGVACLKSIRTSELYLFNQVLVGHLGKSSSLISVKVDVVCIALDGW